MNSIIKKHFEDLDLVIAYVKKELATLRTGRANPIILENIPVDSYGVKTPLKQLSSISVPEARTMTIQPWDQNLIKEIEKAITEANIGLTPVNEGKLLRITVPQLTTESRKELVKNVHKKVEDARIRLRGVRDKIREEIITAEKEKEFSEDEKFESLKSLDELIKEYNEKIRAIGEEKEKEIMTI